MFISVATPPPEDATTSTLSVAVHTPRSAKETLEELKTGSLAGTLKCQAPPVPLRKVRLYCWTQMATGSVGVMETEK